MFKSSNPILNRDTFRVTSVHTSEIQKMTIKGTALKGLILLLLAISSSVWVWQKFYLTHNIQSILPYITLGTIGGLICAIVTNIKKEWSQYTAPLYSVLEGFAIGGISAFFESRYPGIAIQAASLTFSTFIIMFGLYSSNIIPVTDKLRMGITSAIGGIALIYFASMIMSFFGSSIGFLHSSNPIGIGFSIIVVGVAAFSLLLDFDLVSQGEAYGAPKYMEWYAAFGIMVTLVWLYMEILRLLAKFRNRRD